MAGNYGFEAWLVRDAAWIFERLGPHGELIGRFHISHEKRSVAP